MQRRLWVLQKIMEFWSFVSPLNVYSSSLLYEYKSPTRHLIRFELLDLYFDVPDFDVQDFDRDLVGMMMMQ